MLRISLESPPVEGVMMSQDSVMEFPCEFPVKVMGGNAADFEAAIVMMPSAYP